MKLGLRQDGENLVIYREKWGVLALGIALGGILTGFAAWFYALGVERGAPMLFIAPFSLVFAAVGLAIWWRLPSDARRWFAEDGAVLLQAAASGLDVALLPGAIRRSYAWDVIDEIALVETLKSVESDETGYNWRVAVIFFTSRQAAGASWFDLAKLGLGRTAQGRVYILVSYPRKRAEQVEVALRAIAPASVRINRYSKAIFDHKRRADAYFAA